MAQRRISTLRVAVGLCAVALIALSLWRLEGARAGVERVALDAGTTPATLYRQPGSDGPLVVIAHGFAGSRQMMEPVSLTLARSGYAALAFDFEGHGRNRVPMGGDVGAIEGTTARLVAETRRVIDAGLAATGWQGPVALVGHSMATDVAVRAALADARVGPVVAISMYSEAVTPRTPPALLIVTGAWEPHLRAAALRSLRMVDPTAREGQTARAGDTLRRAVVAPNVEHVGVLYSPTTLRQTRDWLNAAYGRDATAPVAATGGWIALLLGGIVALGWCLAALLPSAQASAIAVPLRPWLAAVALPALAAPLIATQVRVQVLPVLVADYLALHLWLYGTLQLAILWRAGIRPGPLRLLPVLALLGYALGVFGLALDRYAASFVPFGTRLPIMAAMALGAVPFMLADALMSQAGAAALWRRTVLRAGFFASLALAVWLDPGRLMFLVIILPVIVLYFAVFGSMGRWVGLRAGPAPVGVALGLVLAWSLAASFPLFQP